MLVDPLVVVAAVGALGSLLLYFLRSFATGDLMSKNMVPRADYEALRQINAAYPAAIERLTGAVEKLADVVDAMRVNGPPGSDS